MNQKVINNLEGRTGNYIFPFFWQHGEDEQVLRTYMKAIQESNIGAVCIESRPHPDFAGPGWWRDLDIILDEARKRNMKVWILDDSHFPTGFCNGALEQGPVKNLRQFITCQFIQEVRENEEIVLETDRYRNAPSVELTPVEKRKIKVLRTFDDDKLLGFAAVPKNGLKKENIVFLKPEDSTVSWWAKKGEWKIYACHKTRNRGPHRNYMNMLDQESCRRLIDAVYEPHYARYKHEFGTIIAGFFSDEPELGNDHLYEIGKKIEEMDDLPWSDELEEVLKRRWGENFPRFLPLLWEKEFEDQEKAAVRYDYMNMVTSLVKKNFSMQIGNWCREHGVEYIGHLIEDNNQHSRTGCSLGHYYRGLAGQDMAGIDDIGGQVFPYMEDVYIRNPEGIDRDGEFYHYMLGKLASSLAAIDPLKKNRSMCEIFGAYGWEEGVKLEKYLADHFMVRGVNHFVPHAFSPKAFPDPDCPPHFYAHGNHPQYRHFGYLMRYMNRICELINGGRHIAPVAVLYHGEAEWVGECMYSQKPAHLLADNQIDYDILPGDVFAEPEQYHTAIGKQLTVGGQEYAALVIPYAQFITQSLAAAVCQMISRGFPVFFLDNLPEGMCDGEKKKVLDFSRQMVVPLNQMISKLDEMGIREIRIYPSNRRIRYLHYVEESHIFYFFNEGNLRYDGFAEVPVKGDFYRYDAWRNELVQVCSEEISDGTKIKISMDPMESVIIVNDRVESRFYMRLGDRPFKKIIKINENWKRSFCTALEYPKFYEAQVINLPDHMEKEYPKFSGIVRYEKDIDCCLEKEVVLEITDAAEGVEVFVNGISAGIQVVPVYQFDITNLLQEGKNHIAIEVATTLARSVPALKRFSSRPHIPVETKTGLCGEVQIKL